MWSSSMMLTTAWRARTLVPVTQQEAQFCVLRGGDPAVLLSPARRRMASWTRERAGVVAKETGVSWRSFLLATSSVWGRGWRSRISLATVSYWGAESSSSKAEQAAENWPFSTRVVAPFVVGHRSRHRAVWRTVTRFRKSLLCGKGSLFLPGGTSSTFQPLRTFVARR